MKKSDARTRRTAPLQTPTDLGAQATKDVSAALNLMLEVWIDEAERRVWFLYETGRK